MFPENIRSVRGRLLWNVQEIHVHFMRFSPALAMIAHGTCGDDVRPGVLSAHVARDDVINRQAAFAFAAILAGIIVAAEYFTAR